MRAFSFFITATCLISPLYLGADVMQFPTDVSQEAKPATIKVLIAQKRSEVLLEARGHYQVCNPVGNFELDRGITTKRAFVTASIEGLNWNGFFPGVFQIRVTPTDAKSSILVDGIEYRGCVEIYAMGGELHVVNEIDVERYLKSTLTDKVKASMPKEVLESVAILARTEAYHLSSKTPHSMWHVKADDVGYLGYGLSLQSNEIDTAVNTTRYLVLTHHHAPFATAWTENSAGRTADFASIFRKDSPACYGIDTPFAKKDREKSAWSFTLSKAELSHLTQMDTVHGIDLYQDPKTQKVYAVRIKDKKGSHDIDFLTFQNLLGSSKLRSSDFSVEAHLDKITFKGYGQGHGVGLCLYSATQMASHGDAAPKILAAFFPEAKLETMKTVEDLTH